jgi:YD repeat-containing protein
MNRGSPYFGSRNDDCSERQLTKVTHPTAGTFTYVYDARGRMVAEIHMFDVDIRKKLCGLNRIDFGRTAGIIIP